MKHLINHSQDVHIPAAVTQPVQRAQGVPALPCELEECVYVIHRDEDMPMWFVWSRLGLHHLQHVPHVRQEPQQVPGTQQPEYRHEQVVVEDHAESQDQVLLLSMGGGHSDDQLPLPTTQPDVRGGGRCTTSPRESDNNRQAQSKQRCCTTSPRESDNDRQAQTKQRGATTDPQPEANGTKKATEGESAMYNQHTACSTNQVSFSTLTDVMLPSQSWTDAITMPHNGKWGRVRDPGPKEGGARHDAARHYPYQHEEGRRHHLSPLWQNTPPQGPYMVGPPEPKTEASQK